MTPFERARIATAAVIGLAVTAGSAAAAPGYIDQPMNLRAGPGVDYPLVASLPQGTPAEIFGCLSGWSWCDVATAGLRGWVAGVGVEVLDDNRPVPLDGYGQQFGVPFIGFDFGNYWGHYYRGRSWYSQTDRWHGGGGGFDRDHGFDGGHGDRRPDFDRNGGGRGDQGWGDRGRGEPGRGGPGPGDGRPGGGHPDFDRGGQPGRGGEPGRPQGGPGPGFQGGPGGQHGGPQPPQGQHPQQPGPGPGPDRGGPPHGPDHGPGPGPGGGHGPGGPGPGPGGHGPQDHGGPPGQQPR